MYISNGRVAWQIPEHLQSFYRNGAYIPPAGWKVVTSRDVRGWVVSNGGYLYNPAAKRKKGGKHGTKKEGAKRAVLRR